MEIVHEVDNNFVIVIFGVDNSLSSHTYDPKKTFRYLVKDRLMELMIELVQQNKNQFNIIFSKIKTKF